MEALKIVLLAIVGAVLYGILHDQVTVRVSLEYFTVAHPKVVETQDPTVLALVWGVLATWWMGLLLGLILACAARAGSRVPIPAVSLVKPLALVLLVTGLVAACAGLLGHALGQQGNAMLQGNMADRIDASRHARFVAAWFSHLASYGAGALGALLLAAMVWWRRPPAPGVGPVSR